MAKEQTGTFEISHTLTPCPQKRGVHLPYKRFSSSPAPPDSICVEAGRHASFRKQVLLKKSFDISTGRHLGKAWPENHLRRNQAGVCDQAQLLWAKEDIQGAEGQRNRSWEMDSTCHLQGGSDDERHVDRGSGLRTHCSR